MVGEQVHSYPRWLTVPVELICTIAVVAALLRLGRDLLRYLWDTGGIDAALFSRVPLLPELVLAINGIKGTIDRERIDQLTQLLPALGWLALALLLALLLRNSLPTVRTSPRGMLVEFAGDWLPIPWESLHAIKVTEDLGAERFVLLAETTGAHLTGWHRFYSLLYRIGFRRGFLIISAINDFDGLIKTLLSESDRVARVLDHVRPARLQEDASSPLFRFLLGPASFFSRRTKTEGVAAAAPAPASGSLVRGFYPSRISAIFTWGSGLLAALLILRYVTYWLKFLAITFPALRPLPIFNRLDLRQLPAPWWLLVAAHLLVLIMLGLLVALRNLLPALEVRVEGLAVRYFQRWLVIPWSRISAIKVTEFSPESQIVLIQTSGTRPLSARLSSLIYDGSLVPGVLVTSALSNFEPLLQRVILEVTRSQSQSEGPSAGDTPILQSEARSPLLLLSFRAGASIDRLVSESREDEQTKELTLARLLRAGAPMFWLALPPSLLMFCERAIQLGVLPDLRLIGGMIALFLLSLLEWPLVCLATQMLDEMTGGGEEGQRAFYLYPLIQLPRLLPLAGALIMVLLGVPFLPVLFWLGAIVWSFLLAAGLWEALYDWSGGQLLAGGLVPVVFQLLILLAYLVALR